LDNKKLMLNCVGEMPIRPSTVSVIWIGRAAPGSVFSDKAVEFHRKLSLTTNQFMVASQYMQAPKNRNQGTSQ
jgi:hypothetical protein